MVRCRRVVVDETPAVGLCGYWHPVPTVSRRVDAASGHDANECGALPIYRGQK
ncbi:MAG TPA: hypothetical protein V6D48_10860 [Oculatellaceae cyanobacterium]